MENTHFYTTNNGFPYNNNYTTIQLQLPLILSEIIDIDDPVYTFDDSRKGIDLKKYLVTNKSDNRGRKGYNPVNLLKVILFGFQLHGYVSTRELEGYCRNDIRFRLILGNSGSTPSHMTISNFINNYLLKSIEDIFKDINNYIFNKCNVNTNITYIDGTKIEANANKYSWVWKNASLTNRNKLYKKISSFFTDLNTTCILQKVSFPIKDAYEIDELENLLSIYINMYNLNPNSFVSGKGKRKSEYQKDYETFIDFINKLKKYAYQIDTCGEHRNSFSKTDKDATFMRIKTDYMGNDQLLPSYNLQIAVCNEFIALADIYQYASDNSCFVPFMDKYYKFYKHYPTYPVADAGYGSYDNYLFCEEHNMNKFMKFSTYKKETSDKKYQSDPFRVANFKVNKKGQLICPNNKKFIFIKNQAIKGNKYGRTVEVYQCENCNKCKLKSKCHKGKGNRKITLNKELTKIHQEVIDNLSTDLGIQLRINRSIQVEGAFGIIKQDRDYRRIVRRSMNKVRLELLLISIRFNLYKYNNIKKRTK